MGLLLAGSRRDLTSRIVEQPAGGTTTLGNGTSMSAVLFLSDPFGGYPPYTYDWQKTSGAGANLQTSSSATSLLESSGTDTEHVGIVVLVLTDVNGVISTASASFDVTHGSPP